MAERSRAFVLVAIQFASAAFVLFPDLVAASWEGRGAQCVALLFGLWAIVSMRPGNLSVSPLVKPDAVLVMRGPYSVIRHPMYFTVLLYTLVQCIDRGGTARWCGWGILLVDLMIKMRFEERQLCKRFPTYAAYMQRTKRLIPWVV